MPDIYYITENAALLTAAAAIGSTWYYSGIPTTHIYSTKNNNKTQE